MGLPDTLKAKNLFENRKELINKAFSEFDAKTTIRASILMRF